MVSDNTSICPCCGGDLKHYDTVKRLVRTKWGRRKYINVRRRKCVKCGKIHRVLPEGILPYKHYEAEIIFGVVEGLITPEVLGFEDYPCETTMKRWRDISTDFVFTERDF